MTKYSQKSNIEIDMIAKLEGIQSTTADSKD